MGAIQITRHISARIRDDGTLALTIDCGADEGAPVDGASRALVAKQLRELADLIDRIGEVP